MALRLVAAAEPDHRLVDRGISVGIEPHGLAYDVGGFGPSAGEQAHFIHGIEQFSVGGFEAVNFRNGPGQNHTHGIGHEIDFQCLGNGLFYHFRMEPHHARDISVRSLVFLLCHLCFVLC